MQNLKVVLVLNFGKPISWWTHPQMVNRGLTMNGQRILGTAPKQQLTDASDVSSIGCACVGYTQLMKSVEAMPRCTMSLTKRTEVGVQSGFNIRHANVLPGATSVPSSRRHCAGLPEFFHEREKSSGRGSPFTGKIF